MKHACFRSVNQSTIKCSRKYKNMSEWPTNNKITISKTFIAKAFGSSKIFFKSFAANMLKHKIYLCVVIKAHIRLTRNIWYMLLKKALGTTTTRVFLSLAKIIFVFSMQGWSEQQSYKYAFIAELGEPKIWQGIANKFSFGSSTRTVHVYVSNAQKSYTYRENIATLEDQTYFSICRCTNMRIFNLVCSYRKKFVINWVQ